MYDEETHNTGQAAYMLILGSKINRRGGGYFYTFISPTIQELVHPFSCLLVTKIKLDEWHNINTK